MSIDTVFSASVLGFTPLASEHWGLLAFLVILAGGGVWFFLDKKLKTLAQQSAEQAVAAEATLKSQKEAAATQAAAAQKKLDDAAVAHQLLDERYNSLRDVSQRREQEAEQRIGSLSADLAATRELAAQLEPTKSALAAERGRISALEQTIEVSNKRAEDFERRLDQSHRELTEQRQTADQRVGELQAEVAKLNQTIKANEALVATADSQVSEATETLNSYKQQAEARIANLQRQLTAAEAKSAMVQKEFMSAVGVLPDKPSPPKSSAPAAGEDKRLAELEAKITQIEADARKKAREDGYKIAELEFRLSEAQEALAQKDAPQQE
jgi:DNA repair exonuclease SbcCD ATPase subunit